MNFTNNQSDSGSAVTMAQHVANELRKSGTKAWAGLPSPEEMEQLKAERAEHDFQALKNREEAKGRKLAELKESVKRKLRGEISDE